MTTHASGKDILGQRKERILAVQELPALAANLDEALRLAERRDAAPARPGEPTLADVLERDVALTVRVLRMVNSPIYGFPGRIDSLPHAVVLLGPNVIRGIVVSTAAADPAADDTAVRLGLWDHALACARLAEAIGRRAGLASPEAAAVAGLLHDLGKLAIARQLPELQAQVDELLLTQQVQPLEAEQRVLGFGHDRAGAWLADHWHLPPHIQEAIAYHHKPQAAPSHPRLASAVHLADALTHVAGCGGQLLAFVPAMRREALECLGLTPDDLGPVLDEVFEGIFETGRPHGDQCWS